MPTRSKRPCRHPGCPVLTENGICTDHIKPAKLFASRERGSSTSRGYGADWERVRIAALERDDYLCVHCRVQGRITPAHDVDHIEPFTSIEDPRRLNRANLQSLCRPCHRVKTAKQYRKDDS